VASFILDRENAKADCPRENGLGSTRNLGFSDRHAGNVSIEIRRASMCVERLPLALNPTIPVLAFWDYYFLSKPWPNKFPCLRTGGVKDGYNAERKGEGALVLDIGDQSAGCIFW
jgi:hypothetical protein